MNRLITTRSSLGYLAAAPAALPTAVRAATGYIAVVVNTPPDAAITCEQLSGAPGMMLVAQGPSGKLQEVPNGVGVNSLPFSIGANELWTFYLLPYDQGTGNAYAPVESVSVLGKPGVYASSSTPQPWVRQLKERNPTLPFYSSDPAQISFGALPLPALNPAPPIQQTGLTPAAVTASASVSSSGTNTTLFAVLGIGGLLYVAPKFFGR